MRSYLVEDIFDEDYDKIRDALNELEVNGPIEDIYYLPLPQSLLQQEQKDHLTECGPYFMALETVQVPAGNSLKLEMLVRGKNKMRCSCICYATPEQRRHMIEYLDQFIEELEISV